MNTEVKVLFDDQTGQGASMMFIADGLVDPADYGPLVAVLNPISDAAINGMAFTAQDVTPIGATAAGDYDSAQDKALFIFRSVGGDYQIAVPAPEADIFLPDKETVNATQADVAAFIAAIQANSTDPAGNALTFVKGLRQRTSAKY